MICTFPKKSIYDDDSNLEFIDDTSDEDYIKDWVESLEKMVDHYSIALAATIAVCRL